MQGAKGSERVDAAVGRERPLAAAVVKVVAIAVAMGMGYMVAAL